MSKKQTAVEWLFKKMESMQYFIGNDLYQSFKQAKEMEKEQIMEAYFKGTFDYDYSYPAEQYYNETYKTEQQ